MDNMIESEAFAKERGLDHIEVMEQAASVWKPMGMAHVARGRLWLDVEKIDQWNAEIKAAVNRTPKEEVEHILSSMELVWFDNVWTDGQPPLIGEQLVYVVCCEDYIKIGIAVNPGQRIRDMQVGNPFGIYPHSIWRADKLFANDMEWKLHAALKEFRVRGEWFRKEALDYFTTPQTTAQTGDSKDINQ